MVLPRDTAFAVSGECSPNREVAVRVGARPEQRAQADAQGLWRVTVAPLPASAVPCSITVRSGTESVACTNVLVGDLWLCAGQSNMAFPLRSCDAAQDALAAACDPLLRCLNVECRLPTANKPWDDKLLALSITSDAFRPAWCAVTPQTAPALSGVAVLFGQALRRTRPGVPLGLVQLAVGGAPAEAFTPADERRGGWLDDPAFPAPWCQMRAKVNLARALAAPGLADVRHPYEPGLLYGRAVAPLAALFPVSGVLWYQGESNATDGGTPDAALDPAVMRQGIESLIASWRRAWHRSDLPFVLVMLPRMNRPWMLYREQQLRVAQAYPHVGLAVATDTGEPNNVHPADKQLVAARAAREALRIAYRDPSVPGPTFALSAAGGSPVVVRFTSGQSLSVKGESLVGFELSADGAAFVPARAALRADSTVTVAADGLSSPIAVRYNWSPVPLGNLCNAAGIPVPPFRLSVATNR
jgi:sialate O-acetylesterase